ncbi:hypothetical protein DSL72_006482 [Monilinia vaccinii-corymbosi]|uniref:Uncharacterized protein n=1 Tax=Monilinia vaccinii-corymbosi TaxID=61207 RepID=A0A8A3PMC1_9HELO|nr:hypothetical protein DSL72_006482 [Monilinia vaccinii-corymbosi]
MLGPVDSDTLVLPSYHAMVIALASDNADLRTRTIG